MRNPKNFFKYNYNTSAWDRLISKTQTTDEFLKKGDYARSKQRDFESEFSQKNITPTSNSGISHHFSNDINTVTAKGKEESLNTKSTFKMCYTPRELGIHLFVE